MAEPIEEPGAETGGPASAGPEGGLATVALALLGKRRAGKPDDRLDAFLDKQGRLIDLQMEHLHEQRELQLSRLRWGRFSDRMKAVLQTMTAAVGIAVAGAVGVMAWQAHQDHGLTVAAFSVSPDLAQRGLTGQVIASQVLDAVAAMQDETNSVRPADTYESNWGDDIKVELPQTGVSIGDLNRFLRQQLGHETRISGEVYRSPAGVAVTARVGSSAGRSFSGTEAELPQLIARAAEAVYAETQPYRHAVYAYAHGRQAEAVATYAKLATDGPREDRAWAYGAWAMALYERGQLAAGRQKALQAVRSDPKLPFAYGVLQIADYNLSHPEEALWAMRKEAALVDRASNVGPGGSDAARTLAHNLIYDSTGDYQRLLAGLAHLVRAGQVSSWQGVLPTEGKASYPLEYEISLAFAENHQPGLAMRLVASYPHPERAIYSDSPSGTAVIAAEDLEDWAGMAAAIAPDIEAFGRAGEPAAATLHNDLLPRAAYAQARMGDRVQAHALIDQTPLDCGYCLRTRGKIAAAEHDWAAADRWFGEAVRQAPSSPFAYVDWARALVDQGRPDAAIEQVHAARKAGPHDADAAEVWGEALLRKNDPAAAVDQFKQADEDAPRWGRNHLRWGEALARLGKADEARAQWRAAAGMDLSAADRAELGRVQGGAPKPIS